jgi:hypothetical protein
MIKVNEFNVKAKWGEMGNLVSFRDHAQIKHGKTLPKTVIISNVTPQAFCPEFM